ncbi:hypothetical protein EON65_57185 [archaeon]|nr:MAG: hypothetical protein EON65_57185 [archaeon]
MSSIERELGDIRETIRSREQNRVDQYQLISLLEAENRALRDQSGLLELQLRQEREREQDEEERVQVAYAEMDRVQAMCTQALVRLLIQ